MRKKRHNKKIISPPNYYLIKFSVIGTILSLIVFSLYLVYGISQTQICANSISCIKDLSGKYEPATQGIFLGQKVPVPRYISKENFKYNPNILGQSNGNKHISVDLSTQHLYAYEGDRVVMDFPVSTGKWYPTPTGIFRIWIKLRYTRMEGGNPAWGTYYNLPNVPHVMFFYNDQVSASRGFSLHGAYWHNNFGHPMSHGCVNIGLDNAEKLYNWADPPTAGYTTYATNDNPGTLITIYGTTPAE